MWKVILMAGILAFLGQLFGNRLAVAEPEIAQIYSEMRERALTITAEALKLPQSTKVVAVLMETGYPEATATLVAVADGAASLYFSNGGGIIGTGEHKGPRAAGAKLLSVAEHHLPHLTKAASTPLPKVGNTTFYVVTPQGTLTATAQEQNLAEGRSQFSDLFIASQNLITQIRLIEEAREKRPNN